MKILKRYIWGFASGALYATINYLLISPLMRHNIAGVILWGIQGFIFVLTWDIIDALQKNIIKKYNIIPAVHGAVSGLVASSLSIIISILGLHADSVVNPEIWKSLFADLILYALGCSCLGIAFGLVMYKLRFQKKT